MDELKRIFRPDPVLLARIGKWPKWKLWTLRMVVLVFLLLWVGLWFYLHTQAEQSRALIERRRIEASRRQESARRQAAYQQAVDRYQKASHTQSQMYGE